MCAADSWVVASKPTVRHLYLCFDRLYRLDVAPNMWVVTARCAHWDNTLQRSMGQAHSACLLHTVRAALEYYSRKQRSVAIR